MKFFLFFLLVSYNFNALAEGGSVQSLLKGEVTHCDCEEAARTGDCSPDCKTLCAIDNALIQSKYVLNEQCSDIKIPKIKIDTEVKSLGGIASYLSKTQKKIIKDAKKVKEKLKQDMESKGCESCYPIHRIESYIQPNTPKSTTCGEDFKDKTYKFRRVFVVEKKSVSKGYSASEKESDSPEKICTDENKKKIYKTFKEYGEKIITGSRMNKRCPSGCSFYTTSSITIDQDACSGVLDMNVKCGQGHGSWSPFVADFQIEMAYEVVSQCPIKRSSDAI